MFKNPKRWHRRLGLYIYFAGILMGMFFTALLTWADLEAYLFNPPADPQTLNLENLHCPILLNGDESGVISATFSNPADRTRRRMVDSFITQGSVLLTEEERERFDLEPGEERTLQWTVSSENAAWSRFIFVRIQVQRNTPLPARAGSCGVLVFHLPYGTGAQIIFVTVGAILLLMVGGATLWLAGDSQRQQLRRVDYLTLAIAPITLVAMIFSMMGMWLGSGLLLLLTLLLIVSIMTWALS
jgi:hypothetical protein